MLISRNRNRLVKGKQQKCDQHVGANWGLAKVTQINSYNKLTTNQMYKLILQSMTNRCSVLRKLCNIDAKISNKIIKNTKNVLELTNEKLNGLLVANERQL